MAGLPAVAQLALRVVRLVVVRAAGFFFAAVELRFDVPRLVVGFAVAAAAAIFFCASSKSLFSAFANLPLSRRASVMNFFTALCRSRAPLLASRPVWLLRSDNAFEALSSDLLSRAIAAGSLNAAAARAGADLAAARDVDFAGAREVDVERARDVDLVDDRDVDVVRARVDAAGFLAGGIDNSSVLARALERLHAGR
jgi:hypothetical protein